MSVEQSFFFAFRKKKVTMCHMFESLFTMQMIIAWPAELENV